VHQSHLLLVRDYPPKNGLSQGKSGRIGTIRALLDPRPKQNNGLRGYQQFLSMLVPEVFTMRETLDGHTRGRLFKSEKNRFRSEGAEPRIPSCLVIARLTETLPAPAAVDVTICAPAGPVESVRDDIVELVSPETGPVDSARVTQQQPKALPSDGRAYARRCRCGCRLAFTPRPGWSTHLRVAPKQPNPYRMRRDGTAITKRSTVLLSLIP